LSAAANGHEGVVKIPLERGEPNPDPAETEYGSTPFWLAVGTGHDVVVKMLLGRGRLIPTRQIPFTAKRLSPGRLGTSMNRSWRSFWKEKRSIPTRQRTNMAERHSRVPLGTGTRVVKLLLERTERLSLPWRNRIWPNTTRVGCKAWTQEDSQDAFRERKCLSRPRRYRMWYDIPPSFALHGNEYIVKKHFRSLDPNTNITDPNDELGCLLPNSDKQEPLSDLKDSVLKSPDNGLHATSPSVLPQASSMWPLKFPYCGVRSKPTDITKVFPVFYVHSSKFT